MINSFLSAIQFLTVIPIKLKNVSNKNIAGAMMFFPAVGLILGLFISALYSLLAFFGFSQFVLSIIAVIALVVFTGGMHLDGLSDTADAFFSNKPKEDMLDIMRDPRAGVMGVISIICAIFLKIGLLLSVKPALIGPSLVLMCVLSRWSAVLAIFLFPYARSEGKAKVFTEEINLKIFLIATIIAFLCAFFIWREKALAVGLIAAGVVFLFGKFSVRKIGGITGDVLGATIELTEIVVLFSISVN